MRASDLIGAIGVGLLLVAYLLTILKTLHLQHPTYLILNIVGAGLACFASALIMYWPFIILEGVWAIVSCIALTKTLFQR